MECYERNDRVTTYIRCPCYLLVKNVTSHHTYWYGIHTLARLNLTQKCTCNPNHKQAPTFPLYACSQMPHHMMVRKCDSWLRNLSMIPIIYVHAIVLQRQCELPHDKINHALSHTEVDMYTIIILCLYCQHHVMETPKRAGCENYDSIVMLTMSCACMTLYLLSYNGGNNDSVMWSDSIGTGTPYDGNNLRQGRIHSPREKRGIVCITQNSNITMH